MRDCYPNWVVRRKSRGRKCNHEPSEQSGRASSSSDGQMGRTAGTSRCLATTPRRQNRHSHAPRPTRTHAMIGHGVCLANRYSGSRDEPLERRGVAHDRIALPLDLHRRVNWPQKDDVAPLERGRRTERATRPCARGIVAAGHRSTAARRGIERCFEPSDATGWREDAARAVAARVMLRELCGR